MSWKHVWPAHTSSHMPDFAPHLGMGMTGMIPSQHLHIPQHRNCIWISLRQSCNIWTAASLCVRQLQCSCMLLITLCMLYTFAQSHAMLAYTIDITHLKWQIACISSEPLKTSLFGGSDFALHALMPAGSACACSMATVRSLSFLFCLSCLFSYHLLCIYQLCYLFVSPPPPLFCCF